MRKKGDAIYTTYHELQMLTMLAIIAGHYVEMIVDTGAAVYTVSPNFAKCGYTQCQWRHDARLW